MTTHRVAPGRAVKHDGAWYDAGADIPDLSPADVALFLADGTIVPVGSAPPPAVKPRRAERTQGLDPIKVP